MHNEVWGCAETFSRGFPATFLLISELIIYHRRPITSQSQALLNEVFTNVISSTTRYHVSDRNLR